MIAVHRAGWIGIDIGSHAIKVAQLQRTGGLCQVREAVVVPRRRATGPAAEQPSLDFEAELAAAMGLGTRFHGKEAACVVSLSACDARTLVIPCQDDTDVRREALVQLAAAHGIAAGPYQIDCWATPAEPAAQQQTVISVAMRRELVSRVTSTLAQQGLQCMAIDGLPAALARIAALGDSQAESATVGVLDWGLSHGTYASVRDGQVLFVRRLRDAGFGRAVAAVADTLAISFDDALVLLASSENRPSGTGRREGASQREIEALLFDASAAALENLAGELQRTVGFLRSYRAAEMPQRIDVVGGGTIFSAAIEWLAARLSIPVSAWRPRADMAWQRSVLPYGESVVAASLAMSLLGWKGE